MKNGFIYPLVDFLIKFLEKINLVELFKVVAIKLSRNQNKKRELSYTRIAVDIYILLKWLFILIIWNFNISNTFTKLATWYLIIMGVHTYFYRHVWYEDAFETTNFSVERVKRRFVNLIQAFSFSNVCFAYLYYAPYSKYFQWCQGDILERPSKLRALWYSISNSVAANYCEVTPIKNSDIGNSIMIVQLIISFFFIAIILSKSVPNNN